MDELVNRVLSKYALMRTVDATRAAETRIKVSRYIQTLAAAGQKDKRKLAAYGLAYLKELHEGTDRRFTGC